ncbi:unannotated protein [freshwater metagenome]|uniref:Unannotated protein n=1 Tax=freshwater metagenome TaxID=449393 RepID=A0A6J7IF38_9ZZZZ|nr:hypothetical protein [Actinomycetota bacterium]
MSNHKLVVMTNATAGNEEEFNTWYNEIHLPEVVALPGFVAATRFKLSADQLPADVGTPNKYSYLAIYDLECSPEEAFATLLDEVGSGRMVLPDSIDQTDMGTWAYDQIASLVAA